MDGAPVVAGSLLGNLRFVTAEGCDALAALLKMGAKSNRGMHPTADTHLVIYFQRCGAAGDARR